jgi:type IV secretion system protein VirB9
MARTHKISKFLPAATTPAALMPVMLVILSLAFTGAANAASLESDNRIKTMVYNENDVFRVVARNGFQTNIELGPDENIETMSIGDSIGWQITPAAKRIFIKPLLKSGITNLTVITNRRSYQFELVATSSTANVPEQAYVVKFYYPEESIGNSPDDRTRGSIRPVSATPIPELPKSEPTAPAIPVAPVAPAMPGDVPAVPVPLAALNSNTQNYNFNYTLTGPDELAPVKIFDDGKSTFFQFKPGMASAPNLAVVTADGREVPVPTRADAEGRMIVDAVAPKFTVRDGSRLVCVFNEQASPPMPPAPFAPPAPSPTTP